MRCLKALDGFCNWTNYRKELIQAALKSSCRNCIWLEFCINILRRHRSKMSVNDLWKQRRLHTGTETIFWPTIDLIGGRQRLMDSPDQYIVPNRVLPIETSPRLTLSTDRSRFNAALAKEDFLKYFMVRRMTTIT
jgi:hypothetical protein